MPLRLERSTLAGDRRRVALALLTPAEASRFASDPHPERFLTGRMLLRELAAELTGRELERVPVTAACPDCGREHGQPRVAGLHVSLSHAGDRTVAVVHPDRAIGVDIERRDVSPERVAAIREIAGGVGASDPDAALARWTRIEAVLKADGRGLRIDPRAVVITDNRATLDGTSYTLSDASDDEFVVSIAVRQP
jgi:4'-phosphopantetheinyl transferase